MHNMILEGHTVVSPTSVPHPDRWRVGHFSFCENMMRYVYESILACTLAETRRGRGTVRRVGLRSVQNTGDGRSVTESAFRLWDCHRRGRRRDSLRVRRIDDLEAVQTAVTGYTGSKDGRIPGSETQ